jgi:hypothetical protein
VFKNEKRKFGAAVASLRSRLRLLNRWLPNGNAKRATCFSSSALLVITCMVRHRETCKRVILGDHILAGSVFYELWAKLLNGALFLFFLIKTHQNN